MKNKIDKGMIDISNKPSTDREAIAKAILEFKRKPFELFVKEGSPKGNVFEAAKIAGIFAAKNTANIIPLCHPLLLSKVDISFELIEDKYQIEITSLVKINGKTGVEMEALTAVTVAALTIYDMTKCIDKSIVIKDVKLIFKKGGKSGLYKILGEINE